MDLALRTIALLIAEVQEKTLRTPDNCVIFLNYYIQSYQEAFMRRCIVLAVCVFFIGVTQAQAEFYRWVDKDGKEFFTNDQLKVPPEYRSSATKVEPDESRVSVGDKHAKTAKTRVDVSQHKDKNGRGEEYWRKRAADLRRKLRDQEDGYSHIQKQLTDLDREPNRLNEKNRKSRASLEKKKTKLEKDIARTRRMLDEDLPEEARRADAYPGWIRE